MAVNLLSALLILFVACNSEQNAKTIQDSTIPKDSSEQISKAFLQAVDNAQQTDRLKLFGIWTDGSTENATFDIRKDSIYYVDHFATYKYSLTDDRIKIFYSDWTFTGAVVFSKDTMMIVSEDRMTKYWKFKD